MSEINIIYWRDIPTQIVMGKGRKAIKRQLANRFMVAVDKAAMNDGVTDTDAYLADWHKVCRPASGNDETADETAIVEQLALLMEAEYPAVRLAEIAANMGRTTDKDTERNTDKDID
ncbi:hypothetical protein MNBD_ALPHA12-267 [hydrothermal vent metagenome]|uniref:Virulence factor domain-containing protein n=1 Tax=hydrothermal vent metagenome TaxID=652676 RepID=A0A3B0UCP6_9ZZZZ